MPLHTSLARANPSRIETGIRLVRLFSLGATILYPLAGLATSADAAGGWNWMRLVAVGILFHVYADVGNDVMDLPIDRTDPRRMMDPLVRGTVPPQWAVWLALVTVPLMAVLLQDMSTLALVALVAAVALIGVYDLVGKSVPIPLVADLLQGMGWASLVVLGAEVGGGATGATWWASGLVVLYIAMVNGIHGGIRDVENDRRVGALTTAVMAGVEIGNGKRILLPGTIVIWAMVLQSAIGVTLAGTLLTRASTGDGRPRTWAVVATGAVFLASGWMLLLAFARRHSLRDAMAAGTWHLFLLPLALLVATVWRLEAWTAAASVAVYLAPPLLYGQFVRRSEFLLPSSNAGEPIKDVASRVVRGVALWQMTRIGVPAAAAMLVLAGAWIGGRVSPAVLAAMLATAATVATANVFNDRCDVVADRINRPERPLPSRRVSENDADKYVLGASIVAFAASGALGIGSLATVGSILVLGLSYSLFLRRWVGIGQFSVAFLLAVPILYGGAFVSGRLRVEHWLAAGLVFVFVFTRETIKGLPDRRGDRAAGYRTLATEHGDSEVLSVFRRSAALLVVGSLGVAVHVRTIAHLSASILCVVVPTMIVNWYLRGTPSVEAVEQATARFGYVFALGMAPLFLMA